MVRKFGGHNKKLLWDNYSEQVVRNYIIRAPKQRKFANEYIKTNNAYQSAIKAGYTGNYAKNATNFLLENNGIREFITKKTGKVVQQESAEADEVLANIYRISAGKAIERHYVKIDNLTKESMDDNTIITPASTKEQVAAAELWFKLNGQLKTDSKEVEEQKGRKLKADADLSEQKAKDIQAERDAADNVRPIIIQSVDVDLDEDVDTDDWTVF